MIPLLNTDWKKCISLFFFYLIYLEGISQKQIKDTTSIFPYSLEDIIQSYMESREEEGDFDYNTLSDKLEYLQKKPVDINNEDELDDLILLRPSQIISIKEYIRNHGALISIYELQAIPGIDIATIKMIVPFISLDANFDQYQVGLAEMLRYGKNQLFIRTGQILQSQKGYLTHKYLGNAQRVYLRYRHFYENKLSIGFTAEKDPGEEFFKGSNKNGFDYYSFHAAIRNIHPKLKELVIGDFNLSFGQGLIMHSGFGVGKSPWATSIRKSERSLRPYSSVNESNFLRGIGINLRLSKNWELTMIGSIRKKDGNIISEDSLDREAIFSSFQESGYHRTINEINDENAITERMLGGSVKYQFDKGHISSNGLFTSFGSSLQKQDLPYNQFSFKGNQLSQLSIDHSFQIRNFNFFGEAAIAFPGKTAIVEGVQIAVDKKMDLAILYRNLAKSYPALYSNAFSENTLATNESGLYVGSELRPHTRWKISAYWDLWSHPWLRYNVQRPSVGNEQLLRISYSIRRKMETYLQYRNKNKEENFTNKEPIRPILINNKRSVRYHINYSWNKNFETRTRIEYSHYQRSSLAPESGFMVYQDLLLQPIPTFSFTSRIAYFNTDSYDSGIYAYENDLLYNFYVPNYNGKGWRIYFNVKSNPLRNITLEARYASSIYNSTQTIGSGNDLINGHVKSEVKFQVRWEF